MGRKVEQNAEEQTAKFLERARKLDLNSTDVKIVAAVAGLGLAAVGAYLASRKLGNRAKTAEGEDVSVAVEPTEYMERVSSFVRKDGDAASFPMDDETAAKRLTNEGDGGSLLLTVRTLLEALKMTPGIFRQPGGRSTLLGTYLSHIQWKTLGNLLSPKLEKVTPIRV
jgi:hypothetical protein